MILFYLQKKTRCSRVSGLPTTLTEYCGLLLLAAILINRWKSFEWVLECDISEDAAVVLGRKDAGELWSEKEGRGEAGGGW